MKKNNEFIIEQKIIEVVDRKREQEMDTTFDSVQYNKKKNKRAIPDKCTQVY